MRKSLSDRGVAALKPRPNRYAFPDPELTGHYVRVQPSGAKAFVAVARDPAGKQVWTTIGATDITPIVEARELARTVIRRVRAGQPAVEPAAAKPDTFADVAANWLKRHVEANALRTRPEIERHLTRYVLPLWGEREMAAIRRRDVAELLDRVQDEHGARQADAVLTTVRSLAHWYGSRNDEYIPPFTRGMKRAPGRARSRILDDDEIRALWKATEGEGRYNAIVRLALLSGQRQAKIAGMKWSDVSLDGTWTVPTDAREKGTGGELVLPPVALDIIRAQPRIGANPYVFPARDGKCFNSFPVEAVALIARMPPMAAWVFHDLRRTARSLLSRAGVRPDIAERVLGHVQGGVLAIYDRHSYRDEKADALARLASLVQAIVDPQERVVAIRGAKR
jgi:integrase